MRRGLVLLALAIVCLLAGCTAWMGGSYASVTPHAEGYAQTEPVDTAVASSQSELISVLARLVKNHTDQASVDVSQYEGDLEKELDLAVLKVMETDPVVAYAAEDIRLQQTEVGVRQMVSVEITYSRTQEELQAIQTAWGENGIKSRVTAALERVEPAITLQVTNYQPVNLDLFVRTYYEDHLETIMECPQVVVQVYPSREASGWWKFNSCTAPARDPPADAPGGAGASELAAGYVEGQTSEEIKASRLYAFSLRPLRSEQTLRRRQCIASCVWALGTAGRWLWSMDCCAAGLGWTARWFPVPAMAGSGTGILSAWMACTITWMC